MLTLELPPELGFDPADHDADGIPDAVHLLAGPGTSFFARYLESPRRLLQVALSRTAAFPSGGTPLLSLEVHGEAGACGALAGLRFDRTATSFGSELGQSVAGNLADGAVDLAGCFLFADGFETGLATAWK